MNESILKLLLPAKSPQTTMQSGAVRDYDRDIILPIIILLMAERCDFFLVFALLYILM